MGIISAMVPITMAIVPVLQVDREVASARHLLDAMGGKIHAVSGRKNSAQEFELVKQAMERGNELQESAWMPRKDELTKNKDAYFNPWTKEVRTREGHLRQQSCCDCGLGFAELEKKYVFMATTKKPWALLIDTGKSSGKRRYFCHQCFKKKANWGKRPPPQLGSERLKYYKKAYDKDYQYEPVRIEGMLKLKEREREFMVSDPRSGAWNFTRCFQYSIIFAPQTHKA